MMMNSTEQNLVPRAFGVRRSCSYCIVVGWIHVRAGMSNGPGLAGDPAYIIRISLRNSVS